MELFQLENSTFGLGIQGDSLGPITDETKNRLKTLLDQEGLLVIRARPFSAAEQVEIVSSFGSIELDSEGEPLLMRVTNQYEDSSAPQGALGFHFDYAYDRSPIPVISLYGAELEPGVTPTVFVDSQVKEGEIPCELYMALAGQTAVHCCFPDKYGYEALQTRSGPEIQRGEPGWEAAHWWLRKPVLRTNAVGVKSVYLCELYTHSLVDLPQEESEQQLQAVYQHLYAETRRYQHDWQHHDLVIWDNLRVQHARPTPNPKRRTLRRFHTCDEPLTEDYIRIGRENQFL